jgi:predicted lactoylglutathione lyase
MAKQIFVNIPVKDLARSMSFWKSVGYSFNPQFTDETSACLVFSENIYAMLLTHEKFKEFSPNPICDTSKHTEVLLALSCESKAEVIGTMEKALAAGARRFSEPKDYGFMLQDSFQDLDGHVWEIFHMDPTAIQK